MSSPVGRTTSSELGKRGTSPSSAQIATEVTGPMPKWAARSAAHPGGRRDSMPSWRRSGSSSPVSRRATRLARKAWPGCGWPVSYRAAMLGLVLAIIPLSPVSTLPCGPTIHRLLVLAWNATT